MVPNNFPGGTMVLVQSFPQMMKLAMRCVLGGAEHDGSSDLLSLPPLLHSHHRGAPFPDLLFSFLGLKRTGFLHMTASRKIDGTRILAAISGNAAISVDVKPYVVKQYSLDLTERRPTNATTVAANRRPKVKKADDEPMWLKAAASVLDFAEMDECSSGVEPPEEGGEEPQWLSDAASALGIDSRPNSSTVRGQLAATKPRTAKHKARRA